MAFALTTRPQGRAGRAALGRALAVLVAGLAVSACGPKDPLEGKVDAVDYVTYSMWRSATAGRLSPRQLADLDEAVQEIRFHIMAEGKVSGSAAVEDEALHVMEGQTVRRVLRQGLGWELKRASAEKSALEVSMTQNALMRTRPGDTASATYLSDLSDRQAARLKAATDQVNHARERLAAAGGPLESQDAAPSDAAPSDAAPTDAPKDAPPERIP
jgi:hypothetical protein